MKKFAAFLLIVGFSLFFGCNSTSTSVAQNTAAKTSNDTIRIANDSLQYEVIIIDGGFNYWLNSTARPRGSYSQTHLESRNIPWVTEWNNRAMSPRNNRERELFQMPINYQYGTNYGYEVNYLIYNYLVYFQLKNNIRLGGFVPRP